jgi:hypothetical protein
MASSESESHAIWRIMKRRNQPRKANGDSGSESIGTLTCAAGGGVAAAAWRRLVAAAGVRCGGEAARGCAATNAPLARVSAARVSHARSARYARAARAHSHAGGGSARTIMVGTIGMMATLTWYASWRDGWRKTWLILSGDIREMAAAKHTC